MKVCRALAACLCLFFAVTVSSGDLPNLDDELLTSSFEGVGAMRNFVGNTDIVVPGDGLPVLLLDDFDSFYLAKCARLDCATGITRQFVATTDNQSHRARLAVGSDGLPVMAYWDRALNAARFDRCNDHSCSDRSTHTLSAGSMVGVDIAIGTDGFPIVAFLLNTGIRRELQLIKCEDLACDDSLAPVTLGSAAGAFKVAMALDGDGYPVIAYTDLEFPTPTTSTRDMTIIHCDSADCKGIVTTEIIDPGPLFEARGSESNGLAIVIPQGGFPVLAANLQLAAGGVRVVTITCNDIACSDHDEPQIVGSVLGTSYFDYLDAALSADNLPMFTFDIAGTGDAANLEFVQCQEADCNGPLTNRTFPGSLVDSATFPVIALAADGNPIMAFYRGSDRGGGVVHCRDPECESSRVY